MNVLLAAMHATFMHNVLTLMAIILVCATKAGQKTVKHAQVTSILMSVHYLQTV